jgi:hypothetical protein
MGELAQASARPLTALQQRQLHCHLAWLQAHCQRQH